MKLVKKDFGKWDKEELSIIKKGYTAKEIADYILYLQDSLKTCGENCAYFGGKYYELKSGLEEILTIWNNNPYSYLFAQDIEKLLEKVNKK